MNCSICKNPLKCHHSIDGETSSFAPKNCHIVNKWYCPNCECEYEEFIDINDTRIDFIMITNDELND